MKLVEAINQGLRNYLGTLPKCVVYGQNVAAGSKIGGLARNLENVENIEIVNSTNSENTLAGFGFGLLLANVSSCYILKQHDFMLLGMDHWRNTWNMIRSREFESRYLVLAPVVDSGYEGPQANLNNLSEFASIFDCPVYLINSNSSISKVFRQVKDSPFSIVGVSQKMLKAEIEDHSDIQNGKLTYSVFHIDSNGGDVDNSTDFIISLGFSAKDVFDVVKERKSISRNLQVIVSHQLFTSEYCQYLAAEFREGDKIYLVDDSYTTVGEAAFQKEQIEMNLCVKVSLLKINVRNQVSRPHSQKFKEVEEIFGEEIAVNSTRGFMS